jgi:hypothetical protein
MLDVDKDGAPNVENPSVAVPRTETERELDAKLVEDAWAPDTLPSEVQVVLGLADVVRTPDIVLVMAAEVVGLVDELGDVDEDMLLAEPEKGSDKKSAMLKPTYVIFAIWASLKSQDFRPEENMLLGMMEVTFE